MKNARERTNASQSQPVLLTQALNGIVLGTRCSEVDRLRRRDSWDSLRFQKGSHSVRNTLQMMKNTNANGIRTGEPSTVLSDETLDGSTLASESLIVEPLDCREQGYKHKHVSIPPRIQKE
jgi:hypothetical protein